MTDARIAVVVRVIGITSTGKNGIACIDSNGFILQESIFITFLLGETVTDFFKREKELQEKATKGPWKNEVSIMSDEEDFGYSAVGPIESCDGCVVATKDDGDYAAFAVNNMHKICELLETALYKLSMQGLNADAEAQEIRAELEKLVGEK